MTRVAVGDHVALSWTPWCGECEECLRGLPQLCSTVWPAMGTGGLMDGTPRLSRDGEPVFHYSFLSTFADACVVPERSCVPIAEGHPVRRRRARRLRGVDRGRRRLAHSAGAAGRPRRRRRLRRGRAVGALAAVAVGRGARGRRRRRAAEARRRALVRRDGRRRVAGSAEATAEAVRERSGGGVDYAIEATGRPEAMEAAFLSTRARGAAVLIGIPRQDAVLSLPALTIPRMERRVLGSIYGSSKPERDFPLTLDLYRDGRLPLDRLDLAPSAARRGRARVRADALRRRAARRARLKEA